MMTLDYVKPTHWMDDMGRVCTAEFMASDKAHGDYHLAYNIPCVKQGSKFVRLPDLAAIREVIAWHQAQASTIRSSEHYDEIIGERLALKHDKQAGKLARAIEKTP